MESIYTELALYGSTNECARTNTIFLTISEVCDSMVSLSEMHLLTRNLISHCSVSNSFILDRTDLDSSSALKTTYP